MKVVAAIAISTVCMLFCISIGTTMVNAQESKVDTFTWKINNDWVAFNYTNQNAQRVIWAFGDGFGSNDFSPTHRYDEGGEYNITLQVTTWDNQRYSIKQTITIETSALDTTDHELETESFSISGALLFASCSIMFATIYFGIHPLIGKGAIIDKDVALTLYAAGIAGGLWLMYGGTL